jgi:alpha-ribazole phosphatase
MDPQMNIDGNTNLNIIFIRHGMTTNNLVGRFGGITDYKLSDAGRETLVHLHDNYPYPDVEKIFSSPASRAIQTSKILFPNKGVSLVNDLHELDFGLAEGVLTSDVAKTYKETIQKWQNPTLDFSFPEGETFGECLKRAQKALDHVILDAIENKFFIVAVISHSVLLSILLKAHLEPYREELRLCPNGMGYLVQTSYKKWFNKRQLLFLADLPKNAPRPDMNESAYLKWE